MKHLFIPSMLLCMGLVLICQNPARASDTAEKKQAELAAGLSTTVRLPALLNYAYLSSPAITASTKTWQAFIENYRVGKSYPDPQLAATYFPRPIETRLGPQDWSLTLSQVIPFPGTLSQKARVLESDVTIARLKVDQTVKAIVTEVSAAFYELVYIQKAMAVAQANLDLTRQMLQIGENAYAGDKALFYDVSKARAQTAQTQYDLLLLKELEKTEKTKINTLLNRSPTALLGHAVGGQPRKIVYSLDEVYELAMAHQEDILMAEEQVQKSEQAMQLTRFDILPSFRVGLFYAGIGDPDVPIPPPDAGDDAVGVQFGMTLPLWFGKNQSRTAQALAEKESAQARKIEAANTIMARISRLWFKLENSERLITLYEKELLPQAVSSVQTAETWFKQGQGSFADFLEIQATATNFQLSLERAKADYAKTLVLLEQAAGAVLDAKTGQNTGGKKP
ncbi:MAG: TolC family protein [Desulfotignum sp.]|nr:TolC family protein [Desulfotignum sp.]